MSIYPNPQSTDLRIFRHTYETFDGLHSSCLYLRDSVVFLELGWVWNVPFRLGEPCVSRTVAGDLAPFSEEEYRGNSWTCIWKWSKIHNQMIPIALNEAELFRQGYREEKRPFRLNLEYLKSKRHEDYKYYFAGLPEDM